MSPPLKGCVWGGGGIQTSCYKNQPFPPFLSKAGKLRTGTKSDSLQCLEESAPASTQRLRA